MQKTNTNKSTERQPLRLWPGVLIVALQWGIRFGLPEVVPGTITVGLMAGLLGGVAVLVWWAFFSRAPKIERWGAIVLMIVAMFATVPFLHESIATGGMGMVFPIYAIPTLSLAFVAWAVLTRNLANPHRRLAMVATILLACGGWTLVRTGGFTGDFDNDFAWRWAKTHEERLLARAGDVPVVPDFAAATLAEKAGWPGFRGPNRDGVIRGVRIETNWSAAPPVELWRRPIGPGWSSFAVSGDLFYTQEQRGDDELVSCYSLTTGEPVWRHRDAARFWESNAGPGPRATPTLHNGRVYTFGATGILNALDAADGSVIWSRNAAADTDTEIPNWGFASSPLVVEDVVIVATEGTLAAYDTATGEPRWFGPKGGLGYSSPHLMTLDGVPQILLMSGAGATSVSPTDGTVLWQHPMPPIGRIVQPALISKSRNYLLVSDGEKNGMRRLTVANGSGGWTVAEHWTSRRLKPYFNDFVVHDGHAFGFDGSILACIDVADGTRKWKGGRYGHGQLLLLADQDVLLVLSEHGELALVKATADAFTELARFAAIEGKTWNHPVLVGDTLLVRNGREMAAFRLTTPSP